MTFRASECIFVSTCSISELFFLLEIRDRVLVIFEIFIFPNFCEHKHINEHKNGFSILASFNVLATCSTSLESPWRMRNNVLWKKVFPAYAHLVEAQQCEKWVTCWCSQKTNRIIWENNFHDNLFTKPQAFQQKNKFLKRWNISRENQILSRTSWNDKFLP